MENKKKVSQNENQVIFAKTFIIFATLLLGSGLLAIIFQPVNVIILICSCLLISMALWMFWVPNKLPIFSNLPWQWVFFRPIDISREVGEGIKDKDYITKNSFLKQSSAKINYSWGILLLILGVSLLFFSKI